MVRGAGAVLSTTTYQANGPASGPQFYCERQSGGLCRMHALNAYFGAPKLNRADFEAEIIDYDKKQKLRGYDIPSANLFDTTSSDHKNIIAHILAKYGVFVRIYEFSQRNRAIKKMQSTGVAFIYSPDHIWLLKQDARFEKSITDSNPSNEKQALSSDLPNIRYAMNKSQDNRWYKIDSLSGVSQCEITDISRNSALGLMIPVVRLKDEFDEIGNELNELVMPDIVDYLISTFTSKKEIGNAETLMGAACSLLELQNNGRISYAKLTELFAWYNHFIQNFHGKNCASLKFILQNVPQIIARIISIWRFGRKLNLTTSI